MAATATLPDDTSGANDENDDGQCIYVVYAQASMAFWCIILVHRG